MKIAIVSDTHERWEKVAEVIAAEGCDQLFYLGDTAADGRAIAQRLGVPAAIVQGNCDDYNEKAPLELEIEVAGVPFLLCHGHRYQVKETLQMLRYRGLERGAQVVCFGHTHKAYMEEGEIMLINPGSAADEKFYLEPPSWGLLEILEQSDAGGKKFIKYTKKDLQNL